MKVQELILALEQVEKMKPGLEVGVYNPEFMHANPIRKVKVEEEIYYDYEKEDPSQREVKQLMLVLDA